MKGLAKRRHHRERMRNRAKRILKLFSPSDEWIIWAVPRWANNMKKCSCDMCQNLRNQYGPTLQEQRFDQKDRWEDE